jgi:hypothetical protein
MPWCSNDDTFEMETASSDALVQIQLLEASCDLMLASDASQVCAVSAAKFLLHSLHFLQLSMSHAAAALQLVCGAW